MTDLKIPTEISSPSTGRTGSDWTPREIQVARIQKLQTKLLQTIRDNSIPADEVVTALGGCIVWILGMNIATLTAANNQIKILRKQLLQGVEKQWPVCERLKADILRRVTSGNEPGAIGPQIDAGQSAPPGTGEAQPTGSAEADPSVSEPGTIDRDHPPEVPDKP